MKTEFVIHLMVSDNNHHDLTNLNNKTLVSISKAFGGFTVTEGRGGWVNEEGKLFDESILRVTVAADNTPENSGKLKQIALNYKQEANQEAVYLRAMDNTVLFV